MHNSHNQAVNAANSHSICIDFMDNNAKPNQLVWDGREINC